MKQRGHRVDRAYYLELCARYYDQSGRLSFGDAKDLLHIEKWLGRKAEGPVDMPMVSKSMHDAMYPTEGIGD